MTARLLEWREIAPNTRHFVFEADHWPAAFVPGQFVSLTQQIGDNAITRAYSLASPPEGKRFALCANKVQDGHFTPFLFAMRQGDAVGLKGPYGAFTLRRPPGDSVMVATGTGIAPFRSMLLARLHELCDRKITLIFGVRHAEGLLYHHEFLRLAEQHPNFTYEPTLTRPPAGWMGKTGRVQPHVLDALRAREKGPANVDIYVCGLREMVDELRANLKEIGVDRKRIIYEKYD